jgi:predicted Ser/Thr protein kinase
LKSWRLKSKKFENRIRNEKGVDACIAANIDEVLSKFQREISNTPFIFTEDKLSEIKGEPDHLIFKETNQNNIVYSFIEDKTIFDIPTPKKNESLVSWWKKDYAYELGNSKVKRNRKSIFHEITQVYGYLSDNSLRYGILTTYECTWFIYRPHPTIMNISSPFACDSEFPTLVQAYCYFLSLLNENHLTDRTPRVSHALKRKRLQTVEISHHISTRAAKRFRGGIPDDFSVEDISVSRILGQGACGSVYEWDYNGKPTAVKLCDYTKNKEGYQMMQKEVDVYKTLASLQGRNIPEFLFSGHISNFFVICTSRINGKPCQSMNDDYQRQVDSICDEMRTLGIVHTDLRESNILLDEDKQIWIIDFGKCDIIA